MSEQENKQQKDATSEIDEVEGHRIMPLGEDFAVPPNAADARRRSALQKDDEEDDVAAHSTASRAGVPPTGMDKVVAENRDDY